MNVSVIIATYGDEAWLNLAKERAYPSAINQGAHEVLVRHTWDADWRWRNDVAIRATGDWLCFLDADDELAPGYLEAMRRMWERKGRGDGPPLLLTPAVQRIQNGRPRHHASFYPEVDLLQANWLVVGTLLERSLFERVGGFENYPHGFEDWSLWNKCARVGAQVVKVPQAVYVQHINPNSKHRQGWRDRKWQVETHQRVQRELEAWTP